MNADEDGIARVRPRRSLPGSLSWSPDFLNDKVNQSSGRSSAATHSTFNSVM